MKIIIDKKSTQELLDILHSIEKKANYSQQLPMSSYLAIASTVRSFECFFHIIEENNIDSFEVDL